MTKRGEEEPEEITARRGRKDALPTRDVEKGSSSATVTMSRRPEDLGDRFQPEQIIAERFRVLRFIGKGGMGEVYEAQDLELRERVALKTLRLRRDEAARATERFRREILLARKVTHPNVCRIFDVFRHEDEKTDHVVLVLTMELLEGETLAESLKGKRLSPVEILPILRQIAAGLEAAHKKGIIHRDLKPNNVMLVPSGKGARTVLMDFGLAHSRLGEEQDALTETGEVLGTLAYMAPEQLEGKPVTASADIYALGVMLYEMLTGKRPFSSQTPLASAIKRLKEAPPSPRTEVPDLDHRWERAILKCLELDPARRFSSLSELVEYLETPQERRPQEGTRAKLLVGTAVAVLILGAGVLFAPIGESPRDRSTSDAIEARRAVAVVGFKNLTGDPQSEWFSTALSEMLTTELAATEQLRVISGETVARMKSDLKLSDADSFAQDTLSRIRARAGANIVVVGAYTALGRPGARQIRLDLKMQDTLAGETTFSLKETGTEAELFGLVSAVGATLRKQLAIGDRSQRQAAAVKASLPSAPEAARAYAEGLRRLRLYDYLGARELLEKVVAIEPDFPLAHSALAEIWYRLEYEGKAVEAAKKAFELSNSLSREERLLVEALYREVSLEREQAIKIYETLWGFFPDNIDYGLRLAELENEVFDRRDDIHETIAALKLIPGSEKDPRVAIAESYGFRGRLTDEQRAAALAILDRAAAQARALGARGIEARARMEAGWLTSDRARALAAYEEARFLYEDAGDWVGEVKALREFAELLIEEGQLERARGVLEQAMVIARDAGAEPTVGEVIVGLASVQMAQGNLDEALRSHEEALAIFRDVDATSWVANANINYGHLLRIRGRLPDAAAALSESLEICRRMSQGPCVYEALSAIGLVYVERDELDKAMSTLEEAVAHSSSIGYRPALGESHGKLSLVLTELGRYVEAEAEARKANEIFLSFFVGKRGTYPELALAKALAAQSKTREAREVCDRLIEVLRNWRRDLPYSHEVILKADILDAQLNENVAALAEIRTEADNLGLVNVALEARLAQATLTSDREELVAVERDARANGYLLLARKAGKARRSM